MVERTAIGERERLNRLFEQAPTFMALLVGPEHRFELVETHVTGLQTWVVSSPAAS